jgi:hypothetical protein
MKDLDGSSEERVLNARSYNLGSGTLDDNR